MIPRSVIRVLHTISDINLTGGGLRKAMVSICEAQAAQGANVYIIAQAKDPTRRTENLFHPQNVEIHLARLAVNSERWRFKYSPFFSREVRSLYRQKGLQIIHDHGLWLPSNHSAARAARCLGVPLVIHPHGMLEPWALAYRAWKKRLAWALYQRRDLESAILFIATSSQEAESIRKLGFRQPIAIVPIGIEMPDWREQPIGDKAWRSALFLSRIHPKKGLLNLVAAWNCIRPKGWKMIVAGPDEENHLDEIKRAVKIAKIEEDFEFVGPIQGALKEKLYREADLFILPTFSENFGIVIAEALSYGIPVITTHGAPWQALVTNHCGWWVRPTADSIAEALQDAVSLSDATRYAMGQRGRNFVETEFSWELIAEQMLDAYQWIIGVGPRPSCIID